MAKIKKIIGKKGAPQVPSSTVLAGRERGERRQERYVEPGDQYVSPKAWRKSHRKK